MGPHGGQAHTQAHISHTHTHTRSQPHRRCDAATPGEVHVPPPHLQAQSPRQCTMHMHACHVDAASMLTLQLPVCPASGCIEEGGWALIRGNYKVPHAHALEQRG